MKLNFDAAFLTWFTGQFPAIVNDAETGDMSAHGDMSIAAAGWQAARSTLITLPARTETLPTGDVLATERANARNQALRECAKALQAAGFKVVGYE